MFCGKCGKPTEGEQTLCNECAAAQAPAVPVEEPVHFEETFVLNTPDAEPVYEAPKKKKKKVGLIALIAALVVVAAVAVGLVLFNDTVGNLVDRTFQSPEDYLQTVEGNAIADLSDELSQSYGEALKNFTPNQTAPGKNAAAMDLRLTLGNDILTLAETALQQQGMTMDLDWLSQINLSINTNRKNNVQQTGFGLGLGNTKLLTLDTISDIANGMFYMAIPEVSQEYLGVNLGGGLSLGGLGDMLNGNAEVMNEALNDFIKALPSEAEMNKLLNTYVDIILSGIDNVEKKTDRVSVGEASQKMVVLTAKITEKDLLNIAEALLKETQKNETLKKFLTAYSNYMNAIGALSEYYEPTDLYQEFVDSIPELLVDLEESKSEAQSDNYLLMHVYVDMQGNIRGHELMAYGDGKKDDQTIRWLSAVKDDTTYIAAELGTVVITGEVEETKDASMAEFDLEVDGSKLCTLELKNVTENSGTVRFIPSEAFMDGFLAGSGIPASLISGNVALELVYDIQGEEASFALNFLAGSKTLIGLELSTKATEGGAFSIPNTWVDTNNQEAVMQWLKNADLDAIVTAMEKTDIPAELVAVVKGYIEMIRYNLG